MGAAEVVAFVRLKELDDSSEAEIAAAEHPIAVWRLDGRICEVVAHALDVANQKFAFARAPREMREGLWHRIDRVNVSVIVVMLDVLPLQEGLDIHHRSSSLVEFDHMHRIEAHRP